MALKQMVCLDDFERYAVERLPRNALDYYRSGADGEVTLADNTRAFQRWRLLPRVLRDVSRQDTHTSILGHPIDFPVCIAPTAMHKMAHPEGELATARAPAALNTAYTLSMTSTSSIEEVAEAAPGGLHFFQLCICRERRITEQLVRRSERLGYRAILLTVDTPMFGKRLADNRNKFRLPSHLKLANFQSLGLESSGINTAKKESGLNEYASSLFDPSLTWDDVIWLRGITSLPLVLKGIMTGSDASKAVEAGVDGIVVSNHGARQLDTVPATIDALPGVVSAVAGRCQVFLDGGVRCGTDVLKALSLGATAVFIGRPALYGLAYDGENGVKQVLQILKDELKVAMALAGCRDVSSIDKSVVVHESNFLSKL